MEHPIKNGVQGKVFVEFVANKDGSISDVKVLKGIGFGCDEEALRVMRNSPDWIPAQHKATKVRQKMVLPITFKLDNNSDINSISSITATSETVTLELGTLYPDGLPAFMDYLASNLEYPAEAKAKGIEGLVQVGFIVEADGTIGNVTLLKGIGSGCDAEAVRLIKNSPNWTPKLDENGKPLASKVVLPIRFKLPE